MPVFLWVLVNVLFVAWLVPRTGGSGCYSLVGFSAAVPTCLLSFLQLVWLDGLLDAIVTARSRCLVQQGRALDSLSPSPGAQVSLDPTLTLGFCSAAGGSWPGGCWVLAAQAFQFGGDFRPEVSGLCGCLCQPGMFLEDKLLTRSHQILPVSLDDRLFAGYEC